MQDYVSLDNSTTYSIMNSLIKPTELFKRIKELGQSAVAVTDVGTLAGAWDCFKYAKEADVKLIMGCKFYFVDDCANAQDVRLRYIILLAKNHRGYKNLLMLNKLANDNAIVMFKKVIPRIDWQLLEKYHENLICTTACAGGILGQLISTKRVEEAKLQAKRLKDIFGDDLALEIQPNAMQRKANSYNDYCDQSSINRHLIKFGEELDIKIVPATDAHFMLSEHQEAHDVLLAIGAGQPVRSGSRLSYNSDFYVKSRQEVYDFFARLYKDKADQWCDNTLYFAAKCEDPAWIDPKYSNPSGKELPEFPVKDQSDYEIFQTWQNQQIENVKNAPEDVAYLRYWCQKEFDKKVPSGQEVQYQERLEEELDILQYQGFCSYMLIVADYIDYCKKNDIPVGPGRGCLTGDTQVLTVAGFKRLDNIIIGEEVFSHTGEKRKVLNTFKFDVKNEKLLQIKLENSFGKLKLTKDHKVYASKKEYTDILTEPKWIEASSLSKDDFIYTAYPKTENTEYSFYKIRFSGLATLSNTKNSFGEGYFSKITSISEIDPESVYDITVDQDHSYLTSAGVVHNSVGGSLVGYLTSIHQADPIKYGLIFARFQNKYKIAYPDCDVDFSTSGRERVQAYIRKKYGEDHVAHVSNVNTITPKVYARDIARAFEFGGDRKAAVAIGTMLADAIPDDVKTLEDAFTQAPLFAEYASQAKYAHLKKFAEHISGKAKAWSTHAGGIIISKRPLCEFIPLRKDKEGSAAIEYEKERAEANGLIKMDTLGLETLDIIKNTYNLIVFNGKTPPPVQLNYDDNDAAAYDLISKGDTFCVFQFGESAGTVDICKRMKPKCMEDLAAITALARPGVPKEFRNQFISAKFSGDQAKLLHPCLENSLRSTYGIPIYDEVMLTLGRDVAGWDLNESDRLRKFIKDKGKHPEKDKKLKKDFIASTIQNGIDTQMAEKLWNELFANFSAYLFNHSHAIVYSFISYQTAYLKAHFPLEFLTANLMSEVKSNAKKAASNIAKIKSEIRKLKVKIIPPDINRSEMSYKIIDNNTLLTGLDSLKFIGKLAIPEILAKRPFVSFEDFLSKVDGRKVNSKSVQALTASGCLDSFGMSRKAMYLYASDYKKKLQVWLKKNKDVKGATFNYPWPTDIKDWSVPEKYAMEIFYLGEGLSGNVVQAYPGFFDNKALSFAILPRLYPQQEEDESSKKRYRPEPIPISYAVGVIEGVIKDYFEFKVKKEDSKIFGQTIGKISLEDTYGNNISITVWPDKVIELNKRLKELSGGKVKLEPGIAIHIAGFISWYEGVISIVYDELKKCVGSPSMPSDLAPKKVSMRIMGAKKKGKEILDLESFVEEFEDELTEQGLAELEDEEIEENWSEIEEQPGKPDAFI